MVTVNDLLQRHAGLDIECLDRIYLNGYVPTLQYGGHVATFMSEHLGLPIPSPAIMEKIGTRFRRSVADFAPLHQTPMVRFTKADRKQDVMRPYLAQQAKAGQPGVAAIGMAQEIQNVFASTEWTGSGHHPRFHFYKADRRVSCFYFYLWDDQFGPAFIKICSYFPYPMKVWVNGHEWVKQQARRAGIGFTELSNGFASCDDPARLQAICDRLGPIHIEEFLDRWLTVLPVPLTEADRAAGYWWELSMRQIETSRTIVFDAPRRARGFFVALVVDNLDIGRPDKTEIIFTGHRARRGRPPKTEPTYKTRISTRDTVGITVNTDYKHSRVKQYLKDGRALRIETVINSPDDLGCKRRLRHLPKLQAKSRAVNARLLDSERVGHVVSLRAQPLSGSRSPPSTRMARGRPHYGSEIVGSWPCSAPWCIGLNALGFTNRSLRAQVSQLLGVAYSVNQASYDLTRLRLNGLITRRPRTNTYQLTPDGQRVAIFYTKVHDRLLPTPDRRRPATGAARPTTRPACHRPPRRRLHRPSPYPESRLKTQDKRRTLKSRGALEGFTFTTIVRPWQSDCNALRSDGRTATANCPPPKSRPWPGREIAAGSRSRHWRTRLPARRSLWSASPRRQRDPPLTGT